ncbi:MAG: hypothetical protein AVDCRST_MAG47-1550 [uncultured Nocardioidaceae bacterium]|uniref:Secreted protein n=1 Tax=uncultured Nocardioidaceae bacterium TaxID=253824 RepID=A0A6J4N1U5_9ACTN|nr:MAG: hypothetical protein AVDCRST_MAG47-1550 [uncultured Nocardioidaceae bacterium]
MRTPLKAGIAGVALATAATMMVGAPSATGDHQESSSAFGFSLGGSPGEPVAKFPEGPREAGGEIPAELEQLATGGILTVTADNDRATATVTDLTLLAGLEELPKELRDGLQELQALCAELPEDEAPTDEILGEIPGGLKDVINTPESLQELCNALAGGDFTNLAAVEALNAECDGNTGTVEVVNARLFNSDQALNDSDVKPNSSLLPPELAPLIEITLNRQTTQGDSFTVDGLVLKLGGEEVAVLASATCGGPIAHEPQPKQPKQAPIPTPVERSVPVTG